MPRLTILIPSPGAADSFENTLASVLQNRPADCEVLVVQPRPYDDPYGLGDEVRFLAGERGEGLLPLIHRGLAAAEAEVVHVLQCGLEVVDGWAEPALAAFADPNVAAAAPLWLADRNSSRILAAGVRCGLGGARHLVGQNTPVGGRHVRRLRAGGPTLAAGFYRRAILEALGGFSLDVASVADVEMALALQSLGYRAEVVTESRVYGRCDRSAESGWVAGRGAERWSRCYLARQRSWFDRCYHPLAWLHDLGTTAVGDRRPLHAAARIAGRLAAWVESSPAAAWERRLEEARRQLRHWRVVGDDVPASLPTRHADQRRAA